MPSHRFLWYVIIQHVRKSMVYSNHVEVRAWMSNYMQQIDMNAITYPCPKRSTEFINNV